VIAFILLKLSCQIFKQEEDCCICLICIIIYLMLFPSEITTKTFLIFFFNEILKKVKRIVENIQMRFTIVIIIQKFIDITSYMVICQNNEGYKRSHRSW